MFRRRMFAISAPSHTLPSLPPPALSLSSHQVEIDDHRSRLQAALAKEKEAKELLEQHKELIALSFQTVEASDKKVQQAVALRAKAQAALAREKQRVSQPSSLSL